MPQQTPLSEEQLAFLMRDERWWHPRKRDAAWQQMIVQGFERLYPANDAPQGEGGAVHVDAYARQRDGKRQAVAEHFRGRPGSGAKRPLPAADRDDVTPQELFDAVGFDSKGPGEKEHALLRPYDSLKAKGAADQAILATEQNYPRATFGNPHDNEADAFRHAYWSFVMARELGANRAQAFGDAHERSDRNEPGERMMDLYNNRIGRDLANDPANAGRDPAAVVSEALRGGQLRTRRFPIANSGGQEEPYNPAHPVRRRFPRS